MYLISRAADGYHADILILSLLIIELIDLGLLYLT
jgi:hypothetical protein